MLARHFDQREKSNSRDLDLSLGVRDDCGGGTTTVKIPRQAQHRKVYFFSFNHTTAITKNPAPVIAGGRPRIS